jgi:glutamate racemase
MGADGLRAIAKPVRIGVFDSGVGGFSILQALQQELPSFIFDYCCDELHFPYGTKSGEDIIQFASGAVSQFVRVQDLDGVIIACGTASTIALPKLRELLTVPVIGVVPAIKPAAQFSKTKHIGLLATKATVSRDYIKLMVQEHAADCRVTMLGSSLLVELAEKKMRGQSFDPDLIKRELEPLFCREDLDVIVLGCTHFPLLLDELERVKPRPIQFCDSASGIVKRVRSLFPKALEQSFAVQSGVGYTTSQHSPLLQGALPSFFSQLKIQEWRLL